ncbi:TIGR00730 family Rossman fold protein [Candidatus Peregrinibacteria bacterium HGW-Peregrinibacteria-1]|jgi:hypothetical protein|nr:MAG: TIGR00730 family Rossman fold protein [Candidatus Peregrinibacteria bacterium HGW-Peregrinibacteria-1]
MREKAKKHVNKKGLSVADIMGDNDFRISIFGSARTHHEDTVYEDAFELARWIGEKKWGLVTGGGPGVMEAANAGHALGDPESDSNSIGLVIKLPHENKGNEYLEVTQHFEKFSDRLDTFMALSNVVVVMPGGIGTCLELFYSWQLVQVSHVEPMPIILVGKMWPKLIKWVREELVERKLVSPEDMDCIHIARDVEEAKKIISKEHDRYVSGDIDYNFNRYKLR